MESAILRVAKATRRISSMKEYEMRANNMLCEKVKSAKKAQLEEKLGKFGKKLFNHIYNPIIKEQCSLANKVITGVLTVQEAEHLLALKLLSIPNAGYSICILADKNNEGIYCVLLSFGRSTKHRFSKDY